MKLHILITTVSIVTAASIHWPFSSANTFQSLLTLNPWSTSSHKPLLLIYKWSTSEIQTALGNQLDEDGMLVTRLLDMGPHQVLGDTELSKFRFKRSGKGFMDITEHFEYYKELALLDKRAGTGTGEQEEQEVEYPATLNYTAQVEGLIQQLQQQNLEQNLAYLTSAFHNRYYKSSHGYDASMWLLKQVQDIVDQANVNRNINDDTTSKGKPKTNRHVQVYPVKHRWAQPSIIATIPGQNHHSTNINNINVKPNVRNQHQAARDAIIILSSHLDSTNYILPHIFASPGADDNGSGTVTLLEAFRALALSPDFMPVNTIQFHWYAAEEGGLLGSQDVLTRYKKRNLNVKALFHQDMTGYPGEGHSHGGTTSSAKLGVIIDYVNKPLTSFIQQCILNYTTAGISYTEQTCGYACSDHASGSRLGYPSAYVLESAIKLSNPFVHTVLDTLDRLSFTHMMNHVRLAVGVAVELGMHGFV